MPAAAIIPAAIGVAGAVGAGIAAKNKVGMNQTAAQNFQQSGQYNPNAFHYGGDPRVAQMDVARFQQAAGAAQGRQAMQAGYDPNADYGLASAYGNNANAMRGQQIAAADLTMRRAQGLTPSIAEQQAAIDTQRAVAAQASQAASARGAAGLALAGQQAASNTANAQAQIANQAQVNAANERLQAEQAAQGAYSGIRGGDVSQQQQEAQQAQFNAAQRANLGQFNTGLSMQMQQMNDAREQAFLDREFATRQAEMQGQMQGQGLLAGSFQQQQALNQARLQANAEKGLQWFQAGMGAASGGAQAAMAGMKK